MANPSEASPLLTLNQEDGVKRKETTKKFPTLANLIKEGALLENVGSTARDHLANERTFLAWTRTGLALIGAGLGLLKWDAKGNVIEGYLVAVMGIVVLVTATRRYFRNMQLLEGGMFEPNVRGILVVVTVVVFAIVAAFVLQYHNNQ